MSKIKVSRDKLRVLNFRRMIELKDFPVYRSLKVSEEPARITFSDKAMMKMMALVMNCSNEIGWHGSVSKIGKGEYFVEDVYLYPMKTTGATITAVNYEEWVTNEICTNFERAAKRHLHGHSHVNMSTFPSHTDTDYEADTIEMLQPDGFYIFMIMNKRLDFWFLIADREDKVIYFNDKVTCDTEEDGMSDILLVQYNNMIHEEKWHSNVYRMRGEEYGYE